MKKFFVLVAGIITVTMVAATAVTWAWVSSRPDAMWSNGGYIVHNNMWNAGGYNVSQTLSANSYRDWKVTATVRGGDTAVKTYPNAHKDFHNWSTGAEPRVTSYRKILSRYAGMSPHVGIYNVAYDLWLNGVADGDSIELMIWTDNYKQVPAGSVRTTATFADHTWKVWATGDKQYLALVPTAPIPSGHMHLRAMMGWLMRHGYMPRTATLGQICYGVEVVRTNDAAATWRFTNFSVVTAKK